MLTSLVRCFPWKLETAECDTYDSICQNKPTSSKNSLTKICVENSGIYIYNFWKLQSNPLRSQQMVAPRKWAKIGYPCLKAVFLHFVIFGGHLGFFGQSEASTCQCLQSHNVLQAPGKSFLNPVFPLTQYLGQQCPYMGSSSWKLQGFPKSSMLKSF